MGLVKIDVHKAERQFERISLSDIECVKGLIKYRWMIDTYQGIEMTKESNLAGDVKPMNPELIVTYIDLDNLIKQCNFSEKQLDIITLLMQGNSEQDIADYFEQDVSGINRTFNLICAKIQAKHDFLWKYEHMFVNHLKAPWDYKQCNRCGWKPALPEFFGSDKRNRDGFKGVCKACETSAKSSTK